MAHARRILELDVPSGEIVSVALKHTVFNRYRIGTRRVDAVGLWIVPAFLGIRIFVFNVEFRIFFPMCVEVHISIYGKAFSCYIGVIAKQGSCPVHEGVVRIVKGIGGAQDDLAALIVGSVIFYRLIRRVIGVIGHGVGFVLFPLCIEGDCSL